MKAVVVEHNGNETGRGVFINSREIINYYSQYFMQVGIPEILIWSIKRNERRGATHERPLITLS